MKKRFFFVLLMMACFHLHGKEMILHKKHILLTGEPGIGKSTIIQTIITSFNGPIKGVYAEEENIDGERTGFFLRTLEGKSDYLAHQNMLSTHRIGKYGVNVAAIESLAVPSISPLDDSLVIIDEIGLIQLCAPHFLEAVIYALDHAPRVLGTISMHNTEEFLKIKQRPDVQIIEVILENRNTLPTVILNFLEKRDQYE